ncbi:MAG: F0F1 ATP synthase subunit delta [Verrucomicrobiales bacterium]|nr:F0F1 ATP synthase subunit delta [Verrucomicrobiales bacterium]
MRISKKARSEAKRLFLACTPGGTLDRGRVSQAVEALVDERPRGFLPVLVHFQRLVKLEVARRTARIESAVVLAEESKLGVVRSLERLYGAGLETEFAEEPALIGGLRVRVGSDVFDGSVQARLAALRETF